MKIISKAARAAAIGCAVLLSACAASQQVAQPYDPYRPSVAVAEPVPVPPRVVYAPSPVYGPGPVYYDDDFPYPYRPSLAMTVFGGGFGPLYRDRYEHRGRRHRDDGHRRRDRGDDRAELSRKERRALREERRNEAVPAANREEGRRGGRREGRREGARKDRRESAQENRREGSREDRRREASDGIRRKIPSLTPEQRRLRRKLWRERREALRAERGETSPERGNGERRDRDDGSRGERRRDRAADTE